MRVCYNCGDFFFSVNWWFVLLPLYVFVCGSLTVLTNFSLRNEQFRLLFFGKVFASLSLVVAQISLPFILNSESPSFFVIATVVGVGTNLAILSKNGKLSLFLKLCKKLKRLRLVAIRYSAFFKHEAIGAFIGAAGIGVPAILVLKFFDKNAAGQFSMAMKLLMPGGIVAVSIGRVYYQRAAKLHRAGGCLARLTNKSVLHISGISLLLSILIVGGTYFLGDLVLGKGWEDCKMILLLLGPSMCLSFIYGPLSPIFAVLECTRAAFLVHLSLFIVPCVALCISYFFDCGFKTSILILSVSNSVLYLVLVFCILKLATISKNVID